MVIHKLTAPDQIRVEIKLGGRVGQDPCTLPRIRPGCVRFHGDARLKGIYDDSSQPPWGGGDGWIGANRCIAETGMLLLLLALCHGLWKLSGGACNDVLYE